MSDLNICSGLTIEQITITNPFKEAYLTQRKLQLYLDNTVYNNVVAKVAAKRCTYWFYCIADECKELLDWFDINNHNGLTFEEVEREMQMESIDILHFVMNLGLELGFDAEAVEAVAEELRIDIYKPTPERCMLGTHTLLNNCIKFIDCLPWKAWKTYEDLSIVDFQSILFDDFANAYRACLTLCGFVGLNKQDIINVYFAKNKENIARQENGY